MEIKDILFYSINIDINEESAHIIKEAGQMMELHL